MNVSEASNTQVLVWRYGARTGAEVPQEAAGQLRLAHELREELVSIAHRREERVANVWADHPEVATAQEAVERSEQMLTDLLERASEERRRSRRRTISLELRDQIKVARAARREAKEHARTIKQETYETAAPELHEARAIERREINATYGEFVKDRGLYHGTYSDIWRKHGQANRRVTGQRKLGRGSELRHHRYDGTGHLSVYLQRKPGQPARTAELLCSPESPWWGLLRLPGVCATDPDEWERMTRSEQRVAGRTEISIRIGSQAGRAPLMWTIPVQVHRPLPPDCEVLSAEAVVRRVADTLRLSLNLTCRVRGAETRHGPPVAVDIGWRSMPDGSIRVAYWRGAAEPVEPVRVPAHLAEILLVEPSGIEGEIRFPAEWRAIAGQLDRIRSRRDKSLARVAAELAEWLETHPAAAKDLGVTPTQLVRWRSQPRMAGLARLLANQQPGELADRLLRWERHDRLLWQWEANERDQLIARRRDAYSAAAAVLARAWPDLLIGGNFVARVARHPADEDRDSHRAEGARAQAKLAAPGELTEALKRAVSRRGGRTFEIDEGRGRDRHHVCGAELPRHVDADRGAIVTCPGCGMPVDRSRNAALNLLQGARENGEATPPTLTLAQ